MANLFKRGRSIGRIDIIRHADDCLILRFYFTDRLIAIPPRQVVHSGRTATACTVLDSIRHEAMRDGMEDHELLTLLAQKDPTKAKALAEAKVQSFTDYVRDPKTLRQVRIGLLETLDAVLSTTP